jgi:hypothetical protein
VLLGAVMVLEAVLLFAGFKMLGGGSPRAASGAELATEEGEADDTARRLTRRPRRRRREAEVGRQEEVVELNVLDFKAPNKLAAARSCTT